jgi:hypothetical protein
LRMLSFPVDTKYLISNNIYVRKFSGTKFANVEVSIHST